MVVATGSARAVAVHVSPDFFNEHTSALGPVASARCVSSGSRWFLNDMVDLRHEIEHLVAEGLIVATCYSMTARWQGDQPISVGCMKRLVVVGGLITHRTDCWDSAVLLTQTCEAIRTALTPFGITLPDSV